MNRVRQYAIAKAGVNYRSNHMLTYLFKCIQNIWKKLFYKPAPKRRAKVDPQTFETGGLYYLADLLDGLDDYFKTLASLRRCNPDAYNFYRQVGAPIIPYKISLNFITQPSLSALWRNGSKRPSLAMVHFHGQKAKPDRYTLVFFFMQKIRAREHVQFTNQDMYECTVFYKKPKGEKIKTADCFYVAVDPVGEIQILRTETISRGGTRRDIPTRRWGVPWILKALVEDNKDDGFTKDPVKFGKHMFTQTANLAEHINTGLLVRARKGNICAAFSISMLRTPYFFKDRKKTVLSNGRAKPIFHIVRTHKRKTGSFVKTHFRGLRRFNWLGYDVVISMPGLHHPIPSEFSGTGLDNNDPMVEGAMVSMKELGHAISNTLDK